MRFYWHLHHDVLVEPALEPIKNRIAHIKRYKPKEERPSRLRLLRAVRGRLPKEVRAVGEAYDKAWVASGKTWAAYDKALSQHKDEIEALHAKECPDCPWDGQTIFPNQGD